MFLKALAFLGVILVGAPEGGPSEELYEKLTNAPDERSATQAEQDVLTAWLESGSPTADLLMTRAMDAMEYGDTDHARALLDRVILIAPEFPEAWNRRAVIFLNEDNYPEALRDLNEVLRLEPKHFGAWTGLGIILEGMGADAEALEAYEEALAIHPRLEQAKQAAARLRSSSLGSAL